VPIETYRSRYHKSIIRTKPSLDPQSRVQPEQDGGNDQADKDSIDDYQRRPSSGGIDVVWKRETEKDIPGYVPHLSPSKSKTEELRGLEAVLHKARAGEH
jgi:hypothetical protein